MSNEMVKINKNPAETCNGFTQESHYPYGTNITIHNEVVDQLNIGALKPGDVVMVRGYAVIETISQDANAEKSSKRMSMQLTEISVSRESPGKDHVQLLYGAKS